MADPETTPTEPATTGQAKLVDINGTVYVRVPREWLANHDLGKGDEVLVMANSDLVIRPKTAANIKRSHKAVESMVKEQG